MSALQPAQPIQQPPTPPVEVPTEVPLVGLSPSKPVTFQNNGTTYEYNPLTGEVSTIHAVGEETARVFDAINNWEQVAIVFILAVLAGFIIYTARDFMKKMSFMKSPILNGGWEVYENEFKKSVLENRENLRKNSSAIENLTVAVSEIKGMIESKKKSELEIRLEAIEREQMGKK